MMMLLTRSTSRFSSFSWANLLRCHSVVLSKFMTYS